MQTDIILETPNGFTIVDAKYYDATTAENAPGWPDIAKQMFYEFALKEAWKEETGPSCAEESNIRIESVFVFPSLGNIGRFNAVELQNSTGEHVKKSA